MLEICPYIHFIYHDIPIFNSKLLNECLLIRSSFLDSSIANRHISTTGCSLWKIGKKQNEK